MECKSVTEPTLSHTAVLYRDLQCVPKMRRNLEYLVQLQSTAVKFSTRDILMTLELLNAYICHLTLVMFLHYPTLHKTETRH